MILEKIPVQASIISRLDEEDTQLAIREYIAGAGDTITAHGLAYV